jgi:IMP dehydrogenase/GMP reductase
MYRKTLIDLDDIVIIPSVTSRIETRSEIDIYYHNETKAKNLPLITAPMDTVVSYKNDDFFYKNFINVCYARGDYYEHYSSTHTVSRFRSISLDEFISIYCNSHTYLSHEHEICIDTANGHMQKMLDAIYKAKTNYADKIKIMVGNIANPDTYVKLSMAGADLVRCSIGSGGACITSEQTAINYPIASLIQECYERKADIISLGGVPSKIVADGGMKKYADIIKCLALGADYVMVGSLFNKAFESTGDTFLFKKIKINQYSKFAKWLYNHNFTLTKKFRGMSTKEVQKKWGNKKLKTSEGAIRYRPVEYTLDQWVENFEHYLKSCMSYSNAKNLNEFIGKARIRQISENAYKRFNK